MLYFDIETNGLLADVTQGHCLVIIDDANNVEAYTPATFAKGAMRLLSALRDGENICGHNIINYDIPVLEKLVPTFRVRREWRSQCIDTLVLARLLWGHIKDNDYALIRRGCLPAQLAGRQSLKAWGYRLGVLKGTYGEQEDAWAEYDEEMLKYCIQDVTITKRLYEYLMRGEPPAKAVELEHKMQWLMSQQERNGFPFDLQKALKLQQVLEARFAVLSTKLVTICPQIPDKVFVPKRDNKSKGYIKGVPIQRYKDFNPSSRQQIEWVLNNKFNYMPDNADCYDEDTGNLKLDDATFAYISIDATATPELQELAKIFSEYFVVSKRLGQLAEGKQAWLKNIGTDGRIHGSVNPCGTVTGRATHSNPNVAQVPHVGSPYGQECRELFSAPDGWYEVGVDACGLELRCLAHYLYPYDKGAYAHTILNGDIHTLNQQAAGLPTRNSAKTFNILEVYKPIENGETLYGDNTVRS